jgi:hypothetical protein
MVQLMKNFGIEDDINQEFSLGNEIVKNKDFSYFVEEIYHNCKKFGISPGLISSWIRDLFDCYSQFNNNNSSLSLVENENETKIKENDSENLTVDLKNETTNPLEIKKRLDSDLSNNSKSNLSSNNLSTPFNPEKKSFVDDKIKIPFISQISNFISQKKKECSKINHQKIRLEEEINRKILQRDQVKDNLAAFFEKEKYVKDYLHWFYKLKIELWDNYNIRIEDISNFAKVIDDFKNHNYDAYEIINEYTNALSLRRELKTNESKIEALQKQITVSNNSALFWESQANRHKQTMDKCAGLEAMNFGYKELTQLWLTILEIAKGNNIPSEEAVAKFFKDIEEQYDNKLGFESKVIEKRKELDLLNNQVFNCQTTLRLNPYIGPTIFSLFQKGISEQDIIGINQLDEVCSNDPILKNSDYNRENSNDKKVVNRSEYWSLLTDKMKKYKDIESAIKDQIEKKEKIQKEVYDLNKQQKEILNFCQVAISLINILNVKMSYFKGFTDHFVKDRVNRINEFSRYLSSNIFLIYINNSKKNNEEEEKEEQ